MSRQVVIYTDGACRGNPGPGGWAAIVRTEEGERLLSGFEPETTNNRMELLAAIRALEALEIPSELDLYTDSIYLKRGICEWLPQWKALGWRRPQGKPLKNLDLWQRLDELCQKHRVRWHWVKGHSGHPENERVDRLANLALEEGLRHFQAKFTEQSKAAETQ